MLHVPPPAVAVTAVAVTAVVVTAVVVTAIVAAVRRGARSARAGAAALALAVAACSASAPTPAPARVPDSPPEVPAVTPTPPAAARSETATFAGGCFWCIEAVFEQLDGVVDVRSGFMGGLTDSPTYLEVCSGDTGHAEVVQVTFDPSRVSYDTLLSWFWKSHDPTTLDRQGADVGTQYRSAIFVHSPEQRAAAERSRAAAQADFDDPIVTEIADAAAFTEADEHHQDYYRLNRAQPYCRAVIRPKLEKLGLQR